MTWPEVSADTWLGVWLGCWALAALIFYRKPVTALLSRRSGSITISPPKPEVIGAMLKAAVFLCTAGGVAYGITTCALNRADMV